MEPLTTPHGVVELERFPIDPRETLRAWDAADEYVLDHFDGLTTPSGQVVILNDEWGALSCGLAGLGPQVISDSFIAQRAIDANLERNGLPIDAVTHLNGFEEPAGPIDVLIVKVPKNLSLLEDQLRRLRPHLHTGTVVIGAGMVKHIHTSTLEVFAHVIGETTTSLARRKARLIFATVDASTATSGDPDDSWPRMMEVDGPLRIISHAGVFSSDRLDHGTRLLLSRIPAGVGDQRIVDLGCGSGAIGATAALRNPDAEVVFIDESYRAVASAEATYDANLGDDRDTDAAHFLVGDGLVDAATASFDLVLTNPPFHVNHAITDATAWRMFSESRRCLATEGELWVVGNRHLAYHAKLKRLFGNCKVEASNPKFVLLRAVKT